MTDKYWSHVDHPEDERYDTITIEIVPRWKESELSGDEWRFSYVIKAWRKGEVIVTRSFSRLEWALQALQYTLYIWTGTEEPGSFDQEAYARTKELCDQPGCSSKAVYFYKRLKPYTKQGNELVPNEYANEYRQFCATHHHRGDCDMDDADRNYEPIKNPN